MDPPGRELGITRLEVAVLIVVLAIPAWFILFYLSRVREMARVVSCVNNQRHIGLALRIFNTDHDSKWPMDLSSTNGGSREFLSDASQLWRHWLVLSNELLSFGVQPSSSILVCPSDKARQWPMYWFGKLSGPALNQLSDNHHLSYFVGLNAIEEDARTILGGDRNLMTNGVPVANGRLILAADHSLGFTKEIHDDYGVLLYGDGRVEEVTSGRLKDAWRAVHSGSGLTTNVWLVP